MNRSPIRVALRGLAVVFVALLPALAQAAAPVLRPVTETESAALAQRVKDEMRHAWQGYKQYAWGHDALRPLSKTPHDWYAHSLLMTPVDALDTLLIMGLDDEAREARELIATRLDLDQDMEVQNFEITIRLLGGLLSSYQLTGDQRLLAKAQDLGERLLPVFASSTGMPYTHINLHTGKVRGTVSNPAETGTLVLEFGMLSRLTGNPVYFDKAKRALVETYRRAAPNGLVGSAINVETGKWENTEAHIGGGIDSYYEYLYKCWRLFGDPECKAMWDHSIQGVNKVLADRRHGGLWYGHTDMQGGHPLKAEYGALDAFMPALLALGGDLPRARALQESGLRMWRLHGIEPEALDYAHMKVLSPEYALRPEIIESAYYLHHFTGDPRYRAMGREFFEAFVQHCRTDAGYAALKDVRIKQKADSMESFVFAETFKYYYLLFAPKEALDFDAVTFNTEAHPLRVPAAPLPVNTFIGTQDEGNTFPGASAPFGMIQVGPTGEHYAGWRYSDPRIRGFGHSYLSGAGCWEQGGQLQVLPVTGRIGPGGDFDTAKADSFDYKRYAAAYTHDGEVGQAGYYKVHLTSYGGVDAEATALTRAAAERYTFAPGASSGSVLLNVGQANERHSVVGSELRIVDNRTVEGKITTRSFCGGTQYTTWFRMEFDRPFVAHGIWDDRGGWPGANGPSQQGDSRAHGAWLTFELKDGRAVTAVSAISHVDIDGARANLKAEGMGFDAMRAKAQATWQRELGSVRIEGGSADDRTVFYTALYHALLQPLTGSDADGRYRGYDDAVHMAKDWTYYEFFSLWDTYRAQNQLLALLRPQRTRDIANSVLKIREQGGWLPRWGYANFETNVMTGDPVTPFLVDLWRYGALKGREPEAYAALRENAFGVPPAQNRAQGRAGNPLYLRAGFVPYDRAFVSKGMDSDPHHGASATLEYALADSALAAMARALGHGADARQLEQRALNWRKVWDADVADAPTGLHGFPRPRLADGSWFSDVKGGYDPRGERGFHEGTAWQYQWLVRQDIPGLAAAMGGAAQALHRLDLFFDIDALGAGQGAARKSWVVGPYSYYSQFRYNPNNEPDLHAPWIYTLLGQPWKTTTVLRAAETLFGNSPGGVTGNDDLGTMSAWYLFSALGMYPDTPGSGRFLLHAPRFAHAAIDLPNGRVLRIDAAGSRPGERGFVRSATWNGQAHPRVWLDWEQMQGGGTLAFELASQPDPAGWGTHGRDLPHAPAGI
ncbi:MAG: GH92 family glycosyl hydrolase [Telluria sp.]